MRNIFITDSQSARFMEKESGHCKGKPGDQFDFHGTNVVCAELRALTVSNAKLQSLQPLALKFRNTAYLTVSFNRIVDLTPVLYLSQLVTLDVSHNKIESLAPLSELHRLTTLRCQHNLVSALAPLARLSKLKELFISHNKVRQSASP